MKRWPILAGLLLMAVTVVWAAVRPQPVTASTSHAMHAMSPDAMPTAEQGACPMSATEDAAKCADCECDGCKDGCEKCDGCKDGCDKCAGCEGKCSGGGCAKQDDGCGSGGGCSKGE